MGEIGRLHEADIVPFKPNDATDVSNELNNIINNGVNDNYNQGTSDVYSGSNNISVVHNANRLEDIDDLAGNGLVPDLRADVDTNTAGLITVNDRVDVNAGDIADLQNKTFAQINASAYTLITGAEQHLRVVYAGNCTITVGDAQTFEAGETFTFTVQEIASRFVVLKIYNPYGDNIPDLYITQYDNVKLTVGAYEGGTNHGWHVEITPVPVPTIVWTPAQGISTDVTINLYPDRVKLIKANAGILNTTIIMPALIYVHDRGYTWTLDLGASGSAGDFYILKNAIDGGEIILHVNGQRRWNGIIVAATSTEWELGGIEGAY